MTESLILGLVVGWSTGIPLGYFLGNRKFTVSFRILVGSIVIILWATAIAISFVDRTFAVSPLLHGIAGGVVTALWGEEYFKKEKTND